MEHTGKKRGVQHQNDLLDVKTWLWLAVQMQPGSPAQHSRLLRTLYPYLTPPSTQATGQDPVDERIEARDCQIGVKAGDKMTQAKWSTPLTQGAKAGEPQSSLRPPWAAQ